MHLEYLYVGVFETGYDSYKLNFMVMVMKINLDFAYIFYGQS